MKARKRILDKYLEMCFEVYHIGVHEKYMTYIHKAMKVYGDRMYWIGFISGWLCCFIGHLISLIF